MSIFNAETYILIKLQSQGDNHAQSDDNNATADAETITWSLGLVE